MCLLERACHARARACARARATQGRGKTRVCGAIYLFIYLFLQFIYCCSQFFYHKDVEKHHFAVLLGRPDDEQLKGLKAHILKKYSLIVSLSCKRPCTLTFENVNVPKDERLPLHGARAIQDIFRRKDYHQVLS